MRMVGYKWHLRELMARRGMFNTTDLAPHLADRGIELSASQVHRLVTGTPERLNLQVLAALCDILDAEPGELFEPYAVERSRRKSADAELGLAPGAGSGGSPEIRRPRRARILPDGP
ncbi:helix-turn-helix transcriptional regulator [Actinomadura sp. NPDC049753]|uniref:helix-turn-helix domain-containing protein n=1 Tax=Actinomadura sp. NPDC049753 TaxID=3154739 RepID=UPI00341BC484